VDLTHRYAAEQNAIVHEILGDLGLADKRLLTVINKVDALMPADGATAPDPEDLGLPPSADVVLVSATRGWGLDELLARVEVVLAEEHPTVEVAIPYAESRLVDLFRRRGRVISERHTADGTVLRGQMPRAIERTFAPYLRRRRRAAGRLEPDGGDEAEP
jgi:GTPase